jgi:ABC-type polysaccharide/polyol phosphate transport system ATPase subunit
VQRTTRRPQLHRHRPGTRRSSSTTCRRSFRISTTPVNSLKERLLGIGRNHYEEFPALHDVDFSIDQGETVGILGHNGSGKSTLLKCIAGILTPTQGQVLVRGRLASLLELGRRVPSRPHRPRERVHQRRVPRDAPPGDRNRFDDIVDFAGLEQFIDEPVKHYSSGMYVRLGFAVAVNLDPDVLLVDEVLAVGDEVFQLKCLSRIKQFQDEGRTIVIVTHAAETVRQICTRAIVLHHGNLVIDDEPGRAIRVFREHIHHDPDATIDSNSTRPTARSRSARSGSTTPTSNFVVTSSRRVGVVDIDLTTTQRIDDAVLDSRSPTTRAGCSTTSTPTRSDPHRPLVGPPRCGSTSAHRAARRRVPDQPQVHPALHRSRARLAGTGGRVRGAQHHARRRHGGVRRQRAFLSADAA